MRIALCLYGPYRHFAHVGASIRYNLLQNLDIDIFGCVHYGSHLALYTSEPNHPRFTHKLPPTVYSQSFSNLLDLCPKELETFDFQSTSFVNSLAQLKSQKPNLVDCYPLAFWANLWAQERAVSFQNRASKSYDKVIVTRADILYDEALPARYFSQKTLLLHKDFGCGSPCDFWFMGNNDIVTKAASRFSSLAPIACHPHTAFANHLDYHNIDFCFADLPLNVIQRRYTGWWYTPYIHDPDSFSKVI